MGTKRTLYTGRAKRVNGGWAISIDGFDSAHAQVRRLDKAEDTARNLVAHLLDVSSDSFDASIGPELTDSERRALESIARAKESYELAKGEIISRQRAAAIQLTKTDGLSVRDAGAIMGLSYQRVAQLTSAGAKDRSP